LSGYGIGDVAMRGNPALGLVGLAALAAVATLPFLPLIGDFPAHAQSSTGIPDFYPDVDTGWINMGNDYIPSETGPQPVTLDPLYPYVGNRQPTPATFRVADLTNPNVMPWALETMKAPNEGVIAGGMGFTPRSTCRFAGTPSFFLYVVEPVYIFQGRDEVLIIYAGDAQMRRIHMNVPHKTDLKPTWYGDSVGHYEGATLVVDTIGLDTRTYVDNYRTPHSENLHVVERWSMNDAGDILEVQFTVEDKKHFMNPGRLTRATAASSGQWKKCFAPKTIDLTKSRAMRCPQQPSWIFNDRRNNS
jgi:hypothetical protein